MTENAMNLAGENRHPPTAIDPSSYEGIRIEAGFRADWIVEDKVIVEVKSVETVAPVHKKQLLTYLRLAGKRLGLLINFHVPLIRDGTTRIVNGLENDSHAKTPRWMNHRLTIPHHACALLVAAWPRCVHP
jgi:hypothetical protein